MTTESSSTQERPGPSVHVVRARKLLYGGLVGGVGASIVCLVVFFLTSGVAGLASSALAAGMVVFFYTGGQLVMVRFADAGARTLLLVSMFSYTARVVILGLILLLFNSHRTTWTAIEPLPLFITTIGVVAGWLSVEVLVFRRLRIDAFDTPYVSPTGVGADQEQAGDVPTDRSAAAHSSRGDA